MTMAPEVFDFADHRRYLGAWFDWKKQTNSRYSYRMVSKRLGTSDPSVLKNLIAGRRKLSVDRREQLLELLELDQERARYFRLLVDFQQATTKQARHSAWLDIAALRSAMQSPTIDSSKFLYMSSWVYSAVRELTHCRGFRPEAEWVARTLRPSITPEQAADALELLERLGFLVWQQGILVSVEPIVRTSQTVSHLGTRGFHNDGHELAGAALERLWDGDREHGKQTAFLGLAIPLPTAQIPELRKMLWETQLKVLEFSEQHLAQADRVMFLNVHLFPVSERTETADPTEQPEEQPDKEDLKRSQ